MDGEATPACGKPTRTVRHALCGTEMAVRRRAQRSCQEAVDVLCVGNALVDRWRGLGRGPVRRAGMEPGVMTSSTVSGSGDRGLDGGLARVAGGCAQTGSGIASLGGRGAFVAHRDEASSRWYAAISPPRASSDLSIAPSRQATGTATCS